MISRLFARHGIQVLNIVRNEDGLNKLLEKGEKHVLNSSSAGFEERFRSWCSEMNATLVFDAVGGEFVNIALPLLPPGSTIIVYGNLSRKPVEFMPPLLVRENKKVIGFFLGHWITENGMLKALRNLFKIKEAAPGGHGNTRAGHYSPGGCAEGH